MPRPSTQNALAVAMGLLLSWTDAWAQPAEPAGPTPQDVQAAAAAFAEGQRAQLRGDHARAAELFEIANASAPSAAALRSAIRNHRAAGHAAQAATGALEALARYVEDRPTVQLANDVITELAPRLARLVMECTPQCVATIDGRTIAATAVARHELFVEPGPHTVRAEWEGRPPVEQTVQGAAGQPAMVQLERPAAPAEPPTPPVEPPAEPPADNLPPVAPPPVQGPAATGLSPAVFWLGTGVTAIVLGVAIWSGLDTLSARDDYEAAPTRAGYDDGVDLEVRTNALFVGSAVLGAATVALGLFFTRWDSGEVQPLVAFGPDGALLGIRTGL